MRLTGEQQRVLNKLAIQNKISWFAVIDGYVYDLEKGGIAKGKRSGKKTIAEFWEGIDGFVDIENEPVLRDLLINLEILTPCDEEYSGANPIIIALYNRKNCT